MSHGPLMKCGHSAQGVRHLKGKNAEILGETIPACIICAGLTPDAYIIAEEPDLTGRKARCTYYGGPTAGRRMRNSAQCLFKGCKDGVCHCEQDSRVDLPFFEYGGWIKSAPEELQKERLEVWKLTGKLAKDLKFVWDKEEKAHLEAEREEVVKRLQILNRELRKQATIDQFYCGCHGWD